MKTITLFTIYILFLLNGNFILAQKLPINKWKYICIDNKRAKWGDFDQPNKLKYFGLAINDLNGDSYKDVVSGRYVYMNPGGNMAEKWQRVDVGLNVDGMIVCDVDNDEYVDILAQALPKVYWIEATNQACTKWIAKEVAQIPQASHRNSQGYAKGQIIAGGKEEILFATTKGIFCCEIPESPENGSWDFSCIIKTACDEGFSLGDINADGRLDVVSGALYKDVPNQLVWWENPGDIHEAWHGEVVGRIRRGIDRIAIADFNHDKKLDIAVTEENYSSKNANSSLYWFQAPRNLKTGKWKPKKLINGYSLHSLDVGDFDNNGHVDIITGEHKGEKPRLIFLENSGYGKFNAKTFDYGKESHMGTKACDFDNDGDLDIVSIAWDNYQMLHLWRNDALKDFLNWEVFLSDSDKISPPNKGSSFNSNLILDVDKDGMNDIVISESSAKTSICWYKRVKNYWMKFVVDNDVLPIGTGSASFDVDNDGDEDILFVGGEETNQVWWWENPFPNFNSRKPWKRHTVKKEGGLGHNSLVAEDFTNNGGKEVAFWNTASNSLLLAKQPLEPRKAAQWNMDTIFIGTKGSFNPCLPSDSLFNANFKGLDAKDINQDGHMDIVGGGRCFLNNGFGEFSVFPIDTAFYFSKVCAGQFINGGWKEVVMSQGSGDCTIRLYSYVNDSWTSRKISNQFKNIQTLIEVDFNKDGVSDLFLSAENIQTGEDEIHLMIGDGNGGFKDFLVSSGFVSPDSKITDLDKDGDCDILNVSADPEKQTIEILLNTNKDLTTKKRGM